MRGAALAAGPGSGFVRCTATLPKTLLPLTDGRTILDLVLANLRSVGLDDAVIVTGFAAERVAKRVPDLGRHYGLRLEVVSNEPEIGPASPGLCRSVRKLICPG